MGKKIKATLMRAITGENIEDKFGKFKEYTGGGTPIPKGEKLKDHPEIHRVQQPRDEEGRFTYNSVNGKGLEDEPRGENLHPFIKDFNLNKVAQVGKVTTILDGKRYTFNFDGDVNKFLRAFQNIDDLLTGEYSQEIELEAKKGRWSKEEKDMIARGESGLVLSQKMDRKTNEEFEEEFESKYYKTHGKHFTGNGIGRKKQEKRDKEKEKEPTPQPTSTPQPTPKPETTDTPKKFDTELAKNNPMEFAKQNKDAISKIMKDNPDFTASEIITLIAAGKINPSDI